MDEVSRARSRSIASTQRSSSLHQLRTTSTSPTRATASTSFASGGAMGTTGANTDPAHGTGMTRSPSVTLINNNNTHPTVSQLPPPSPSSPLEAHPIIALKSAPSVVRTREGSVLARGFILKSDYRPVPSTLAPSSSSSGHSAEELHLRGAPSFREGGLGVWGVAQPTQVGLRTILSVLKSGRNGGGNPRQGKETVWFCTRDEAVVYISGLPFVLRDSSSPSKSYVLSSRASNLEAIEQRLKSDILQESLRYNGLLLIAEEVSSGSIVNQWIAVDSKTVKTPREIWEEMRTEEGYNVVYHRLPVRGDQAPEDGVLDEYTRVLASIKSSSSLVFNCGLGVGRTTFAMCAALIMRRGGMMRAGEDDPLLPSISSATYANMNGRVGGIRRNGEEEKILRSGREQGERDQSLLRLMNVLQNSLIDGSSTNLLGMLSEHPRLLENLRSALLGQYDLVLSLLSCLDDGHEQKKVVDTIVDQCDALVNIRESILLNRVKHASIALGEEELSRDYRTKALAALDRYFSLIAFASFVHSSDAAFSVKFSSWLESRSEISRMISRLRKTGHFYVFSPVHDLSVIAKQVGGLATGGGHGRVDDLIRGGEMIGVEWGRQIVSNRTGIILRAGMILKQDQWSSIQSEQPPPTPLHASDLSSSGLYSPDSDSSTVRGAINFRRVPKSSLYALSQPTKDGIKRVLQKVRNNLTTSAGGSEGEDKKVVWINLREEPLIYINGTPYVLRQEAVSLRNVKSYAGISSSRLELLEDRLKSDILTEASSFDGRLLLHTETEDGTVIPVWETIESSENVKTLKEVMLEISGQLGMDQEGKGVGLMYRRIPITAERAPDFSDVRDIIEIVAELDFQDSAIIVNCQLGRGRSTRALILIALVQRWLLTTSHRLPQSKIYNPPQSSRYSYTVINNLLRTIRSGQEIKSTVDEVITVCGSTYDLLDSIEEARQSAADASSDLSLQSTFTQKGLDSLRAYYFLILFAAFLHETKAETWRDLRNVNSYEKWVKERPVFKTIERELDSAGLGALVPLEKERGENSGLAFSDEVADYVAGRSGRILSAFTLLKSDYFSGLQKMSLPERVDGVPNFRRARLLLDSDESLTDSLASSMILDDAPLVYGTGMPTVDGLRRGLEKMGAKSKRIIWTSMREEPVIFVNGGRPHVLRLSDAPLENVITTGVTAETVESMEGALKKDLLRESQMNGGKILLHDEIQEADGSFTIIAAWEEVGEDILTPREVFALMQQEGFLVDYERLPVTDEQAPIPATYSRIEARVAKAMADTSRPFGFSFNCQMGRGRTTTGMIAASLVYNISYNYARILDLYSTSSQLQLAATSTTASSSTSFIEREADPYLDGEYKIILKLVGVMQHGKLAKKLTDKVIDTMEGVQNLRKAVYDFKLRSEAADAGSAKQSKIFSVAMNYLYRYGTLIVFANFLLEKAEWTRTKAMTSELDMPESERRRHPAFAEWLKDRKEISRILSKRSLE